MLLVVKSLNGKSSLVLGARANIAQGVRFMSNFLGQRFAEMASPF